MDINGVDLSKLPQSELKVLAARAIRLVQNPEKGIGTELFEALLKIVPQACVETVVVDDLNHPHRIYLTWREDEHYRGWHCPGTYIRLGESFEDAIRRVLQQEINVELRNFRSTKIQYSHVDSRGHTIGTVWLVQADGEPTGGKWLRVSQLPEPTLPHHVQFIQEVLSKL
ncbi:MAG: NUDIX hydrolase [Candidatus Wildermuthbacteria bacterium]|nr:NUDIX hydrolase [Candidatus Wildermuthbacteria bacterium]